MTENNNFISEPVEAAQPKTGKKKSTPWALIPIFMMVAILVSVGVFCLKTFKEPKAQSIDFNELSSDFDYSPISIKEKYSGNIYTFFVYIEKEYKNSNYYCKVYDSNGYRDPSISDKLENYMTVLGQNKAYYYDPWYHFKTVNSGSCDWFWQVNFGEDYLKHYQRGQLYKVQGKLNVILPDVENFLTVSFLIDDCIIIETV